MPIYLTPPSDDPRGPDGQGRNRLRVDTMEPSAQCAFRPTSWQTMLESWDTRRARWGMFGRCVNGGNCESACPIIMQCPRELRAFTDRVLFRLVDGKPWAMNRPEQGLGSFGYQWSWTDLARFEGWDFDGAHRDQHGEGFWLKRSIREGSND